jgi:hypothetical protein
VAQIRQNLISMAQGSENPSTAVNEASTQLHSLQADQPKYDMAGDMFSSFTPFLQAYLRQPDLGYSGMGSPGSSPDSRRRANSGFNVG